MITLLYTITHNEII